MSCRSVTHMCCKQTRRSRAKPRDSAAPSVSRSFSINSRLIRDMNTPCLTQSMCDRHAPVSFSTPFLLYAARCCTLYTAVRCTLRYDVHGGTMYTGVRRCAFRSRAFSFFFFKSLINKRMYAVAAICYGRVRCSTDIN